MVDNVAAAGDAVVDIRDLTRRFGSVVALDNVSLSVPRGAVFGLVGVNGAGKTTLLKHVLGLLKAQTGRVRVFDLNPVADPVGVLSRIGYLSEENDLPGWMRVDELVRYTQAFFPNWDAVYAEELRRTFDLDPKAKIKHLSRGQRARVGLLAALAHRPELLLLDDPSSGLDPIVRSDILGAIIRTIAQEGRTVLFSSHLLDEVQRVSDHIAMIDHGKIVFRLRLDQIPDSFHRLTVRFDQCQAQPPTIAGGLCWTGAGVEWTAVCNGRRDELCQAVAEAGARIVEEKAPSLNEIFVAQVGARSSRSEEG